MAQDKIRLKIVGQIFPRPSLHLFYWLISLIGVLLIITSCNTSDKNATYYSDTFMVGFDYPTNWLVKELNDHLDIRNPNGYGMQIFTEKSVYINQAESSEQLLNNFLSEVEFPETTKETPIKIFKINSYDAASKQIITELEARIPKELNGFSTPIPPQLQINVIALKEDDTHVIILTYQPTSDEGYEEQFQVIINSLQFE